MGQDLIGALLALAALVIPLGIAYLYLRFGARLKRRGRREK